MRLYKMNTEEPRNSAFQDALLPIYRIIGKGIKGLKIHVVIGGFSLLTDALLRGSSVVIIVAAVQTTVLLLFLS